MEERIKVLLIENRHTDPGIVQNLLADYRMDVSWQSIAGPHELCKLAVAFEPNIVLCADDMSDPPRRALFDALRLFSSQPPIVLVSRLPELEESATHPSTITTRSSGYAQDTAHLRRCFSRILESSTRPVVLSNAEGFITHANSSACRRLEGSFDRSLGSLVGSISEHRLAYFDAASGLATDIHLSALVNCVTARAPLGDTAVALVALDLDSARLDDESGVNGICAERQLGAGPHGCIIRITQNDFLVAMPEPCHAAEAAFTAQRVLDSVAKSRRAAGHCREPTANNWPNMSPVPKTSDRLALDLGDALQRHALSIQYQPQYEAITGRGRGVEALARWVLCSGESISPSVFIPAAERSGLIHDLGAWVLRSACDTAVAWCGRAARGSILSVNVSALQIDNQFCGVIYHALKRSGFPANQLELEITESALVGNTDTTIECLKEWRKLGVRIAVDDFGTGYSSLNYLSRLPVDSLKLDQSLVHMMTLDSKSAAVMRSIVS
ncbi:MAG TPA: EAL domain-containing protein, partial [Steroidobacteraceae bacterium]